MSTRYHGLDRYSGPFGADQARHLLHRAGFGPTPEEVERTASLGLNDAVERLVSFPDAPAAGQADPSTPDLAAIDGLPRKNVDRVAAVAGLTQEQAAERRNDFNRAHRRANNQIIAWWLKRMSDGPHPLQEKLTLFWHGHFVTSAENDRVAHLMLAQNETFRAHAAGNFRDLLLAVAQDPAMIEYLNNLQNRKNAPNENFARELMELFTLGLDQYTQRDVREVARAFTGWHHDGEGFNFRTRQHDDGPKTIFGSRPYAFTGEEVVEVLTQHPACAPFISSKLVRFFITDATPASRLVSDLARRLTRERWALRPVLRTLLTSEAFFDERAIFAQIKSPVQLMVGTVRLLGVDWPRTDQTRRALERMGQLPLFPPNVKGWPGGRAWINTTTLLARYNMGVRLAEETDIVRLVGSHNGLDADSILTSLLDRLIGRSLPDDRLNVLREAAGRVVNDADWKSLVGLIVSLPEYQLC